MLTSPSAAEMPVVGLDLDEEHTVAELLSHPYTKRIIASYHPSGYRWNQPDCVHLHLEAPSDQAIRLKGRLYTRVVTISPLPRYRPDTVIGGEHTYFRGISEHPWETQRRWERLQQEYNERLDCERTRKGEANVACS